MTAHLSIGSALALLKKGYATHERACVSENHSRRVGLYHHVKLENRFFRAFKSLAHEKHIQVFAPKIS